MRYKYKVRELIADKVLNNEKIENVQESTDMEAMSFKKLRKKLDPKKRYFIEYTIKKEILYLLLLMVVKGINELFTCN